MNSGEQQSDLRTFDLMKMDHEVVKRSEQLTRRAKRDQILRAAAWGGLVAVGLRRRGLIGFALVTFGLERLARTLGVRTFWQQYGSSGRAVGPVDQASWASFPASDPPAPGGS